MSGTMLKLPKEWHCPKCGAHLEATGEVKVDGDRCPVFQCDRCVVDGQLLGEPMQIAYTFAIDRTGTPFDPAEGVEGL